VSVKDFFQKHKTNLTDHKSLNNWVFWKCTFCIFIVSFILDAMALDILKACKSVLLLVELID